MGLGPNTFRNFSTNYGPKFSKDGDSPGTPQAGTFMDKFNI